MPLAPRRSRSLLTVVFAFFAVHSVPAQQPVAAAFRRAELVPLKFASGIVMQPEYQDGVARQISTGLQESGRFEQVIPISANDASAPNRKSVRVTATVTQYSAGSATKRALLGFGAGATRLTVHLVFTDAVTGRLLTEGDAHGAVKYGSLLGGAGNNADAQKAIADEVRHLAEGLAP